MSLRQCLTPACSAQLSATAIVCPHCRLSYSLSFDLNNDQLASSDGFREWIAYYQNPQCAIAPEYIEPLMQHAYRLSTDLMYFRACASDILIYKRCWTCNSADVVFADKGIVFSDPYPEENVCNNCGDRMWQFPNIKSKFLDTSSQMYESNKVRFGVVTTFARVKYRMGNFPYWYKGRDGEHINFARVYHNPAYADYQLTRHFKDDEDACRAIYQRGREWHEETRALYGVPSIAQLKRMCLLDDGVRPF